MVASLQAANLLVENVGLPEHRLRIHSPMSTIAAYLTAVTCFPTDHGQMWRSLVVLPQSLAKPVATVCLHNKKQLPTDCLNDCLTDLPIHYAKKCMTNQQTHATEVASMSSLLSMDMMTTTRTHCNLKEQILQDSHLLLHPGFRVPGHFQID